MANHTQLCQLSFLHDFDPRKLTVPCYPSFVEETAQNLSDKGGLRHDLYYDLLLKEFTSPLPPNFRSVRLFLNEMEYPVDWDFSQWDTRGEILLRVLDEEGQKQGETEGKKGYLLDYFGAVEVSLCFSDPQNPEGEDPLWYYTDYIPILIKRGKYVYNMDKMLQYIYDHQKEMLFNGDTRGKAQADLGKSQEKSLQVYVRLLEDIARVYQNQYAYFRKQPKFRIVQEANVRPVEQLQSITNSTLRYMATHPEELEEISSSAGLILGKKHYLPRHTMMTKPVAHKDIYENKVVVAFLGDLLEQVSQLLKTIATSLERLNQPDQGLEDYRFFLFEPSEQALKRAYAQCQPVAKELHALYHAYQEALDLYAPGVDMPPKFTHTFRKIPEYHRIYQEIHKWLEFGEYHLDERALMLSFLKAPTLYESYVVTILTQYLQRKGWTVAEMSQFTYQSARKNWLYRNTTCPNTFSFTKTGSAEELTLYYQPVIYERSFPVKDANGIDLVRINANQVGDYYTPDFILKYQKNPNSKFTYLILDAKFSRLGVVEGKSGELELKYVNNIDSKREGVKHLGSCFFYGKCEPQETLVNLRKSRDNIKAFPLMIQLSRDDDLHFNTILDWLMEKERE